MRNPYPVTPVLPPPVAVPPSKPGPGTVVDENKLHVTLLVDAVKLVETTKPETTKTKLPR